MKTIQIITLAPDETVTDSRDFDTMKEARQWVKECGIVPSFWERASEVEGYHLYSVHTLQLVVDGECLQDWFPKWANADVATSL